MKYQYFVIIAILALALGAVPASAFTAEGLSVNVQPNGDANVLFAYHLNWAESAIYDKVSESTKNNLITLGMKSILPSKTVSNIDSSRWMTTLTVQQFADVTTRTTTVGRGRFARTVTENTFTTPAVDFTNAKNFLDKYPMASSITPDYKPALTLVRFPGTFRMYEDKSSIPAISYTQTSYSR